MSETILLQDDHDHPTVFVTNSRVTIGSHTYSLEGVTEVKLDVIYRRALGTFMNPVVCVACWLCFWAGLVGCIFAFSRGYKSLSLSALGSGLL